MEQAEDVADEALEDYLQPEPEAVQLGNQSLQQQDIIERTLSAGNY
jgi:hypothetical protein